MHTYIQCVFLETKLKSETKKEKEKSEKTSTTTGTDVDDDDDEVKCAFIHVNDRIAFQLNFVREFHRVSGTNSTNTHIHTKLTVKTKKQPTTTEEKKRNKERKIEKPNEQRKIKKIEKEKERKTNKAKLCV